MTTSWFVRTGCLCCLPLFSLVDYLPEALHSANFRSGQARLLRKWPYMAHSNFAYYRALAFKFLVDNGVLSEPKEEILPASGCYCSNSNFNIIRRGTRNLTSSPGPNRIFIFEPKQIAMNDLHQHYNNILPCDCKLSWLNGHCALRHVFWTQTYGSGSDFDRWVVLERQIFGLCKEF